MSCKYRGCSGLMDVTFPSSVKTVGKDAFYDCESLDKVIVDDIAAWCQIMFNKSTEDFTGES